MNRSDGLSYIIIRSYTKTTYTDDGIEDSILYLLEVVTPIIRRVQYECGQICSEFHSRRSKKSPKFDDSGFRGQFIESHTIPSAHVISKFTFTAQGSNILPYTTHKQERKNNHSYHVLRVNPISLIILQKHQLPSQVRVRLTRNIDKNKIRVI